MAFAVRQGDDAVVRQLLKNSDLNEDVAAGFTALQSAAMFGRETVVRLLLENGASVDAKDEFGWTALHRAARSGSSHRH